MFSEISYLPYNEFLEEFKLKPSVKLLESVLKNEYLIPEERDRRILQCINEVKNENLTILFNLSLFTAPRVFWRLYVEKEEEGFRILSKKFTVIDEQSLLCYEKCANLCVEEPQVLLDEVFTELLEMVCLGDYNSQEMEVVWEIGRKYLYDISFLEKLKNEKNERWIEKCKVDK